MSETKMTAIETMILRTARSRPDQWLDHHRHYLGEVLALQCKGLVTTRIDGDRLQVRATTTNAELS
ncbi:MAG TPA: hypothetical protein VL866_24325 [Pyrinomonadaceae bacterium]|nr:hypothetical protein [Pyrinomonadaceae bacterium]